MKSGVENDLYIDLLKFRISVKRFWVEKGGIY
jgi:hypothetical protein